MFGISAVGFAAIPAPRRFSGLVVLALLLMVGGPSAQAQHQLTTEALGQLLGAARGCSDSKAIAPLTSCLDRYAEQKGVRRELIAAAEKAQRSPWLERPGVCARVSIAIREMILWKTVCRDLGPPPY